MKIVLLTGIAILFITIASFGQCPTVDAGPDITVCCAQTINLNGSAPGAASVSWSNGYPGGNGTAFNDSTLLNASYTMTAMECAVSFIVLELGGVPGCPSSKDQVMIFIHDMQPRLYTAPDQTLSPTVTDVTVSAHHGIGGEYTGIWTTTGSGTFDNPTDISTIYHPSLVDKTNGNVTLTYTSLNACNYIQNADMVLGFSMAGTTGTLNKLSSNEIKVYPSPSMDGIVSVELIRGTQISEIKVWNSLQSEVLETEIKMSDNKATLNFSNLNPGIYFIWVADGASGGFHRIAIY